MVTAPGDAARRGADGPPAWCSPVTSRRTRSPGAGGGLASAGTTPPATREPVMKHRSRAATLVLAAVATAGALAGRSFSTATSPSSPSTTADTRPQPEGGATTRPSAAPAAPGAAGSSGATSTGVSTCRADELEPSLGGEPDDPAPDAERLTVVRRGPPSSPSDRSSLAATTADRRHLGGRATGEPAAPLDRCLTGPRLPRRPPTTVVALCCSTPRGPSAPRAPSCTSRPSASPPSSMGRAGGPGPPAGARLVVGSRSSPDVDRGGRARRRRSAAAHASTAATSDPTGSLPSRRSTGHDAPASHRSCCTRLRPAWCGSS